jgi:hypothetical protein
MLVVRFSSGAYSDLVLPTVKISDLSISWLRRKVRNKQADLSKKRLRFIHSGRVLTDKTNFREEYHKFLRFNKTNNNSASGGGGDGDTDVENNGSNADDDGVEQDNKFYIHCLIGDELSDEELQKENEMDERVPEQSTTPAPVGFDRLASAGFSQEDINGLRQQFRQLYGDLPTNSEGDQRDIRQLEERWIDSSVNEMDEFTSMNANSSHFGGNEDLLIGVLIGCLLGVLGLFLLKVDGLFSKRQKMAIIAGFIVNFSFALIRQWS